MKLKVILRDNPIVIYSYSNTNESLQWTLDISIYMDKDFHYIYMKQKKF